MKTIKINCFGCRKKTSEISATLHIPMAGVWDDYNFNTIFRCDKIYFCDDCYNKIINLFVPGREDLLKKKSI